MIFFDEPYAHFGPNHRWNFFVPQSVELLSRLREMSSQQQISGNLAANPAVLIGNPALLTQVLQMLTANDTTVIKQGEKIMKAFMKNKDSMGALMLQVRCTK